MPTTVRLPIDLRNPQISVNQGNSWFSVLSLSAMDFGHYEFVKNVQGNIFGVVPIPHNLSGTPNAKVVLSCLAGATTGNVVLQVAEVSVAANANFNVGTLNYEAAQMIAVAGSAYTRFDTTFPSSGNLIVTPTADDMMIFEILHNGASASENLAVNLLLLEAFLQIDLA